jgi:hypothetical protein
MTEKEDQQTNRYEDKHEHFTIVAVYEGNYVRYSRGLENEELENEELADEDISTVEEFEKMLQDEEWREVT